MTVAATSQALRASMPWGLLQDGLYDWVSGITGLPTLWGKVAGSTLQAPRAFASIAMLEGPAPQGRDGQGMLNMSNTVPAPPLGQEVRSCVFGLRSLTFTVNIFSDSPRFEDNAMSFASALMASLSLESVVMQLNAAGLAARTTGLVRDLTELQESIWVSRAELEVGFTAAMFTSQGDAEGYVGEVVGTGTVYEGPGTVTVPLDVKGL